MENKINLTCNQCGSNEVIQENDDTYKCRNCGSKFRVTQQIVNVFTSQINEQPIEKNTKPVVLITKEMTKKEFMKSAFLKFIEYDKLPIDIYDKSNFISVDKTYTQFLVMNVHYTGSYSVSIGYDREEMYEDYEEKYDPELGRKVRQKVIKKRVVTDWQPHSGMINQDLVTSVRLGEPDKLKIYSQDILCVYLVNDINALSMQGKIEDDEEKNSKKLKVLVPTNEETEVCVERGKKEIVNCLNLPGDHFKDFSATLSHKIITNQVYIIPTWEMEFQYDEENYYIRSLAYDKRFEFYIPSAEKEVKSEISRKTMGAFMLTTTLSLLSIIASILIVFVLKDIKYRFLSFVFVGLSLIAFIIYILRHKSVTKQIMNDRFDHLINSLEEILSLNGLPKLTVAEKEKISIKWGKK